MSPDDCKKRRLPEIATVRLPGGTKERALPFLEPRQSVADLYRQMMLQWLDKKEAKIVSDI
jgi:hypothetical protein